MSELPLHLLVQNVVTRIGPEWTAQNLGVSVPTVYKYGQHEGLSGRTIPIRHLIKLLGIVGPVQDEPLQVSVDHLVMYFARPARRRISREDGRAISCSCGDQLLVLSQGIFQCRSCCTNGRK